MARSRCLPCVPVRFLVVGCLCLVAIVTTDIFSTVIVSMVRQPQDQKNESVAPVALCPSPDWQQEWNETIAGESVTNSQTQDSNETSGHKYDWSPQVQGLLLGSYEWSTLFLLLPIGYAADRGLAPVLLSGSLFVTGLLLLCVPLAADTSVWLFVVVRVALGASVCIVNPCSFVLLCKWFSPSVRPVVLTIYSNITSVATILFLMSVGPVVQHLTWTGMFYIPGLLCLMTFGLASLVLRNDPKSHWLVTRSQVVEDDEEQVIDGEDALTESESQEVTVTPADPVVNKSVPWIHILTNSSVLSVLFFKFSCAICYTLLNDMGPTFLTRVLHMSVDEISHTLVICSIIYIISGLIFAKLSEVLITRSIFSRTACRKSFSLMTGCGSAATGAMIPLLRCHKQAVIAMIFLNNITQSATVASDLTLVAEMTNKYTGILYSICTIASVLTYILTPTFAGMIIQVMTDGWMAWDMMFLSTSGLLVLANLLFLLFVSADVQDFDEDVTVTVVSEDDKSERDKDQIEDEISSASSL